MSTLRARIHHVAVIVAAPPCAGSSSPRQRRGQPTYSMPVTNDDAVRAPRILDLAQALHAVGEVTIVAPSENQSGKGHSSTISDPIYVDRVAIAPGLQAYSAVATPASCVKVAI